jgi:hypothetical protein
MDLRSFIRRWHSPTIFALVGLCFLLPFATVSCDDAKTTFTGAQLVTWSVPEGGVVDGEELGARVENDASALATATLAVASVGFLLGILGLRGGGWCAAIGLATTLLMARSAVDVFGPEVTFHEGYTLTLLLFLWALVLHAARAWRRRRQHGSHRGSEPYWTAERQQEKLRSGLTR